MVTSDENEPSVPIIESLIKPRPLQSHFPSHFFIDVNLTIFVFNFFYLFIKRMQSIDYDAVNNAKKKITPFVKDSMIRGNWRIRENRRVYNIID